MVANPSGGSSYWCGTGIRRVLNARGRHRGLILRVTGNRGLQQRSIRKRGFEGPQKMKHRSSLSTTQQFRS